MSETTEGRWDALVVLPADQCHDEVRICGNERGLRALRDAIDRALAMGVGSGEFLPLADGEGYHVHVHRMTEEQLEEVPQGYLDPAYQSQMSEFAWGLICDREAPYYARLRAEAGWDKSTQEPAP